MEGLGNLIVPLILIIFAIIKIVSTHKKSAKPASPRQVQRQAPPPPPLPTSKQTQPQDEWAELLEALGQDNNNLKEVLSGKVAAPRPQPKPATTPTITLNLPPTPAPQSTITPAPPPLPPVTSIPLSQSAPSLQTTTPDKINERETAAMRDITQKFTRKESKITPRQPALRPSSKTPSGQPIRQRFRQRQSLREAVIMSEVLSAPLALRQ